MSYKVSIIIPIYNAEKSIENAIESIMKQTIGFENIEVIFINDNSSDDTKKIINKYTSKYANIILINLLKNTGNPANPRNIGLKYASSDYIMYLDQDDTFRENACEVFYNKIISENVDIVCGNYNINSRNSSKIAFDYEWCQKKEVKIKNIHDNPNFLRVSVVAWCKIFKKSLLVENDIKFIDCVGEDLFFSIRSLLNANGIILLKDFIVVEYNVRGDSLSHNITKDYLLNYIEVYETLFEYCENNLIDDYFQPLFNSRMNQLMSILKAFKGYFKEYSEILTEIKKLFLKLKSKKFIFDNEEYRFFFNQIITDNYPFHNSILFFNYTIKRSEINILESLLEHRCKLYIDLGQGFNEKNSIEKKYRISKKNFLCFDLSDYNHIKNIRFDPIEGFSSEIFIESVIVDLNKINYLPLNNLKNFSNEKKQVFLSPDPQYILKGNFKNIKNIKITFKIKIIERNELNRILSSYI